MILGSLRRVLTEARAKYGEYGVSRPNLGRFGETIFTDDAPARPRERSGDQYLRRALWPPLDAIHDREYELFNIQGNVWVALRNVCVDVR